MTTSREAREAREAGAELLETLLAQPRPRDAILAQIRRENALRDPHQVLVEQRAMAAAEQRVARAQASYDAAVAAVTARTEQTSS